MKLSFLLIFLAFAKSTLGICGYESCPKVREGYLNVHLIPHSHDDVGWLKTVDQYYYGDKNKIQLGAVQYTLDSVVEELVKSPDRRFIFVESSFFWRWWTNQDEFNQKRVRKLVESGQLEFIGGGWCMNDEASAHYNAIIDQMSLGLRFLNDTFGQCGIPRVAWQIDPFGHSREMASLFAQMNYDGLFFGRLDYQDKFAREVSKKMEMIWDSSPQNLKESAYLFTGALFNGYNPPEGYCFDIFCEDEPINDDPKLLGYNLDDKVKYFIEIAQTWAEPYRTSHVQMTMGSDFQYMAARTWYKNLDKLIKGVNGKSQKVNLIYSTPTCYLKSVNDAGLIWSKKSDDFFPYASDPHAFWTGYFTSRPTLKYFIHKTNNFLQFCKQMAPQTENLKSIKEVFKLAEPLGVAQHHDAVAGTAKQHVTDDYSLRLSIGIGACEGVVNEALNNVFNASGLEFKFCHQMNISTCSAVEAMNDFVVTVYNPLSRGLKNKYVRLPVSTPLWHVEGEDGEIYNQAVALPKSVLKIPGRVSESQYEIVFKVDDHEGMTFKNFRVTRINNKQHGVRKELMEQIRPTRRRSSTYGGGGDNFWINNNLGVGIEIDGTTGLVVAMKAGSVIKNFSQNFYFYEGMSGYNQKPEDRASGAYIFRPNGTVPKVVSPTASYAVYEGEHVIEIQQTFNEWASQVIRLYDDSYAVEFEWLIGPINIKDDIGREVITRYSTDMKTNGVFFTDANGREILKRQRNFRPTWKYVLYEPVAGNYYPVNSRMIISEDPALKTGESFILLNDRTQGGTSMNDGEMEIMLHRRLLHDDAFGVGEALNEQAYGTGLVARGKHWIVLAGGKTGIPSQVHRKMAQEIFMDRILAFRTAVEDQTVKSTNTMYAELAKVIPDNVHIITIEWLSKSDFLIRFEHYGESWELEDPSEKTKIHIPTLRSVFPFKTIKETTLGGNIWKDEAKRLQWRVEGEQTKISGEENGQDSNEFITFGPMEIRTFIVSK